MTPTSVEGTPVVKASAPALPAARASATSAMPTVVRDAISCAAGFTVTSSPITTDSPKATVMPSAPARRAVRASGASASVVASESATFGPSSGAMTMAPMTTATLSCRMPIAATIAERTTMAT